MKQQLLAVALLPLVLAGCNQDAAEAEAPTVQLESDVQIYSYGMGYQIGSQMMGSPIALDADAIATGIQDAMGQKPEQVEVEKLREVAGRVQAEMQQKQEAMQQEQAAAQVAEASKNEADALAYLAENAKVEGVVVTDSGLQYLVLENAEGAKPVESDVVVVNYRGTLLDGSEFDSSYARNKPAEFPVNAVIPGWTEALQLMNVGSKYKLFIPPNLAYGAGGQGPIGPNAMLIFEVELLEIK